MIILMITPDWPSPPDQGGRIRMWNIIRYLARNHELHLLSVSLFPPPPDAVIESACRSVRVVPHYQPSWKRGMNLVKSLVYRKPYLVYKHTAANLADEVARALALYTPDILFVEDHFVGERVLGADVPRVLDMHNVNHVLYDRIAANARWGPKKVHSLIQKRLMAAYERNIPPQFDLCLTVSQTDRDLLRESSHIENIAVVPNGVDILYYRPDFEETAFYDLIFVGSMDYYPNIDAFAFLKDDILPRIWDVNPEVSIAIVGRNPPVAVRRFGDHPNVHITGRVDDVRPFLKGAKVVLVPLRMGSGTRLKVLETGAMAKAMVGTSIGFEGLEFSDNHQAFIRNTPEDIAAAVLMLLSDPEKRTALGEAAYAFVTANYSWESIIQNLEGLLHATLQFGGQK